MLIDLGDKTGNIENTRVCNVYNFEKYYAILPLNVVIGLRFVEKDIYYPILIHLKVVAAR